VAEIEKERSLDGISLKCRIVDFGNSVRDRQGKMESEEDQIKYRNTRI
jgi:hypothetical protein